MTAEKVSEADSYVMYQGHHFMIPAGSSEEYNAEKVFMGYRLPSGEMVTVDEMMTAAADKTHSYYDKTVGATVGKTVGKIATPTVGKTVGVITTPTVGVVGVNAGVTAGMTAEKVSEADSYVMYQGHHFMIPAGSSEEYNAEKVFMGYRLPSGEMVTVD